MARTRWSYGLLVALVVIALMSSSLVESYASSFHIRLRARRALSMSSPPAAVLDSTNTEKPVPKVPSTAWKWPPTWPFPPDFMEVITDEAKSLSVSFTPSQIAVFQKHFSYYISPTTSTVLEIGAQTESMLPKRETGGSTSYLALTGRAFSSESSASVNRITTTADGVSMPFADAAFDAIVLSSGVESFVEPRDIFREIWRVLKPGGQCIVCFSSKPNIPELKPVKMWTTMTEEQKIWIVGSYYQYSAGEGWEKIEGFDLLGASGTMVFENKADGESCYVVQSTKSNPPTVETSESLDKFFAALLPGLKYLGAEDRKFSALRLAADYSRAVSSVEKENIVKQVPMLSTIYAVLKDVQDAVIPAPMKALLANSLLMKWENKPEQVEALRKGLGLDAADEYWTALSAQTSLLPPRKKILLLAEMVPSFGGLNPRVNRVPEVLKSVRDALRLRFPDEEEKALQLFASDLVISDYLVGGSDPDRIVRYAQQVPAATLKEFV